MTVSVRSVINIARAASSFSHTDTVWSLMRPGEAWNDEMKSSLYQHVMGGILNASLHLHNCFQLLQMLHVQWMVMDDNDNGYTMMMMTMMPFKSLRFGWNLLTLQQLKRRVLHPRQPGVRECKCKSFQRMLRACNRMGLAYGYLFLCTTTFQ